MLFRRPAGHRLKPMTVMGRPLFNRPVLNRTGYYIGYARIQILAAVNHFL